MSSPPSQDTAPTPAATNTGSSEMLQSSAVTLLGVVAFLLALFPSVIKMYETSHWFREGDVSKYDNALEWFSNEKLPYQKVFDSSKTLMRVYFFILPYLFMTLVLVLKGLIHKKKTRSPVKSRFALSIGAFLRRTVSFPAILVKIGMPLRISVGEIMGVVVFLVINLGTFVVRVRRSYPRGSTKLTFLVDDGDAGEVELDVWGWQACEVWAKTLGVITILNIGWYLLMPIGRRSVLLEASGMSWERAVKYHRWVGFYSVWLMTIHGLMYVAIWIHGNGHVSYDPDGVMLKRNLIPWGCKNCDEDQASQHRINMFGIVSLLLVLTMTGFAFSWVRRNKFELFYYIHHLFLPLLIFVCLHYSGAFIYLIPGFCIYGVDKLMGVLACRGSVQSKIRMVSSNVLEFTIPLEEGTQYMAGQYVFLNVPMASFLQWHPFSLTSAPGHDGEMSIRFHLKEAGEWTRKVIELAQGQNTMNVRIDGFYGHESMMQSNRDSAVLIGGGIGVTPMISLAMELISTVRAFPVTLLWVVRTVDEFKIFETELSKALEQYNVSDSDQMLTIKTWITLSQAEPTVMDSESGVASVAKDEMTKISEEEQVERVVNVLRASSAADTDKKQDVQSMKTDGGWAPAGVSNAAALNALIMFLAMWMGLNSLAFTSWLVNAKGKESLENPEEKRTLLDFFLLLVTVVFVSLVAVVAVWMSKVMRSKKNGDATSEMKKLKDSGTSEEDTKSSGSDATRSNNFVSAMVRGRIGCRPDLEQEFTSAATANCNNVGVIACGPLPMIETINELCNGNKKFSAGIDGDLAVFDFVEDDWEW